MESFSKRLLARYTLYVQDLIFRGLKLKTDTDFNSVTQLEQRFKIKEKNHANELKIQRLYHIKLID